MNRPKFEMFSKVQIGTNGHRLKFVVDSIVYNYTYKQYEYGNKADDVCALEGSLELHQEPQKKKLFAWESPDGVILHVKTEHIGAEVFYRLKMNGNGFKRAPEYDIEYPETK
jgi:hypothetical protein